MGCDRSLFKLAHSSAVRRVLFLYRLEGAAFPRLPPTTSNACPFYVPKAVQALSRALLTLGFSRTSSAVGLTTFFVRILMEARCPQVH